MLLDEKKKFCLPCNFFRQITFVIEVDLLHRCFFYVYYTFSVKIKLAAAASAKLYHANSRFRNSDDDFDQIRFSHWADGTKKKSVCFEARVTCAAIISSRDAPY